jgi:hypothetical protein
VRNSPITALMISDPPPPPNKSVLGPADILL